MDFSAVVLGVVLATIAACGALLGFPIYFWVADKRRRGEPVRFPSLLVPILIGLLGVVAIGLFIFARSG